MQMKEYQQRTLIAWNELLDNLVVLKKKWKVTAEFGSPLEQYRVLQFAEITENAEQIKEVDTEFILNILDHITVFETGKVIIHFMDGAEMEYVGEQYFVG